MDDDTTPDEQVQLSGDKDIGHDHIPTVNLRQNWWKPLIEDRPATPEPAWSIPSSDLPVPVNNWASALASTYAPPPENSLLAQTGDMAIFIDWFCKKKRITELKQQDLEGPAYETVKVFHPNLEYLRYGRKSGRPALSISKMKSAYYPDVGLEQMRFYIDRHISEGDRRAIRTHMRILSVVRIEVFSLYGYDYMKIILRRADLKEYIIAERDFKYLYTSDFEDLYLLNLQGPSTFREKWVQNVLQFNKIHKFSDGTLQQIDEALDYRVKEFKVNRMNPGLNTRFWTRNDVDRSKEFMFAIQKRIKTRRIFRNLESFVGGRIREGDYKLLKRTE
ncbi:hypothetical protein Tco_0592840 [Tanacetum coccineum]